MLGFILAIIIGGVAGYIAERIMKADHSVFVNVALGIAGAFLLNLVLSIFFGIGGGNLLWQLLAGIVGACILIWGYREYRKRA